MKTRTIATLLPLVFLTTTCGKDTDRVRSSSPAATPTLVEYTTSTCSVTKAITTPFPSVWYSSNWTQYTFTTTVDTVDYEYGCRSYLATKWVTSMH
ncbi:hypothetical protein BU26DRAFT_67749 [Trematosphaeria pertusa]|uniref:Ig-like domain-containing protein n=1 Tax=Trematosphaeria pertusa TaxID=390896 RepID=A0A6A6I4U4_9PLEO|nr:uncharacterized protein BU26DRAFT_67749 [Trematosphaeria pertusa]KAF2245371.1 hypothetical protein BU26DRAFT_67749 [Trematosphaeria pertusa]